MALFFPSSLNNTDEPRFGYNYSYAFNSSLISSAHFLCTWISKYFLFPGKVENAKIKSYIVVITEFGKQCQEMAKIKDFVSFKSELLEAT